MPKRMAPLGDQHAPFTFKRGDRVGTKNWDGKPDSENSGVIIGGTCEYDPADPNFYREETYSVRRKDGRFFRIQGKLLVKIK